MQLEGIREKPGQEVHRIYLSGQDKDGTGKDKVCRIYRAPQDRIPTSTATDFLDLNSNLDLRQALADKISQLGGTRLVSWQPVSLLGVIRALSIACCPLSLFAVAKCCEWACCQRLKLDCRGHRRHARARPPSPRGAAYGNMNHSSAGETFLGLTEPPSWLLQLAAAAGWLAGWPAGWPYDTALGFALSSS